MDSISIHKRIPTLSIRGERMISLAASSADPRTDALPRRRRPVARTASTPSSLQRRRPCLMTDASRSIAGVILLTIVTIQFGGYFMTRIVRGQVPMTDFQKSFARAGHAHAGVLVILSLVGLLY